MTFFFLYVSISIRHTAIQTKKAPRYSGRLNIIRIPLCLFNLLCHNRSDNLFTYFFGNKAIHIEFHFP